MTLPLSLIQDKLAKLETDYQIKILFACESGSRAWGFPSLDSDFDIRFIYQHQHDRYLNIFPPSSELTFPLDENELDISGWDLIKCLRLIYKSNVTIFEWLQSPIIYTEKSNFCERLLPLCQNYFHQKASIHHYLGVANSALTAIEGNYVKVKKFFYILRPLLAARWNMTFNTIAPMNIQELFLALPESLHDPINTIITNKLSMNEDEVFLLRPELKQFIEKSFSECRAFSNTLKTIHSDIEQLNQFFYNEINHDH